MSNPLQAFRLAYRQYVTIRAGGDPDNMDYYTGCIIPARRVVDAARTDVDLQYMDLLSAQRLCGAIIAEEDQRATDLGMRVRW